MKESEIRPQDLFNRYLDVVRRDIDVMFADKRAFEDVACPACGSAQKAQAFNKLGFDYQVCGGCGTLYQAPRPSEELIGQYYQEGESVRFWSTHFYRETEEARREKIFRPRAELVADLVRKGIVARPDVFVDVGSGYGIFLEEVDRLGCFDTVMGIEPAPNMAEASRERGFPIVQLPIQDVTAAEVQADLATSFEVIEHVYSPLAFLQSIYEILRPGGVVLFTTLTISGFDLQVLWDRSKSIFPPHHINFITVEGMRVLLERAGFEVVEIATPGKLDLDIVKNMLAEDPALEVPAFVRYLLEKRGEAAHQQFQAFLQQNNLSSHIRCIARK